MNSRAYFFLKNERSAREQKGGAEVRAIAAAENIALLVRPFERERFWFAVEGVCVFAQLLAQSLGSQQRLLDRFVGRICAEENHAFAAGTLARIAVLHSPGLVPKIRLAPHAANLNRVIHPRDLSLSESRKQILRHIEGLAFNAAGHIAVKLICGAFLSCAA